MKAIPLDDLEMMELLMAIYPEHFPEDSEDAYSTANEILHEEIALNEHTWVRIGDLLGRVLMLTPIVESPLSGVKYHAFVKRMGQDTMLAIAKRKVCDGS